jgi:protein-L-isoaspartate(D-aspartate) O-methyltransferase
MLVAAGACGRGQAPPPETTGSEPAAEADPPAAQAARKALVRRVARDHGVRDPRVLSALLTVPRHRFCGDPSIAGAYLDLPQPIGLGQTISQPGVVAIMTEALELHGNERVLEVGTGSGYQTAILARLSREAYSIETLAPLGEAARGRLQAMGYDNVSVRIGDGYVGWPEHAPYDRILLTAAPLSIPPALIAQLAEGGILVAPVGEEYVQRLLRLRKARGLVTAEDLGGVAFVPMVEGDGG